VSTMNLRLIKANDMKRMSWKNGGGETLEVAIHPPTSSIAQLDFDWRVSIATVASDGPFSKFPGFDRKLVVWKGDGLRVNGIVREAMKPFTFRGGDATDLSLVNGAVKDFGVITRDSAFESALTIQVLNENDEATVQASDETFILCTRGELRIDGFYLNPGDVVNASGRGAVEVKALDRSDYAVVLLTRL
jgi:environmental stress-induced protein Ves